ncbi:MAG TPA: DUF4382 domain-containing protein [Steroidobacteraceae bacterium]|nr:DUF4382 domain-containing protein [Steroidobacteraceae bacterium]
MKPLAMRTLLCCLTLSGLAACGGSGSSSMGEGGSTATAQNGTVSMMLSDASSDDWATIGVKVLGIALIPQGGGAAVSVYSASDASAPLINLVQLDQIDEILGNLSVPVGTYTGAVLTLGGNSGDVVLTVSSNPEAGFAAPAGSTIASSQIQVQGKQSDGTVPVTVNFVSPLVVTADTSSALDLEVDLSHPAFIVAHDPPTAQGETLWAVNFNGPVRHRPIAALDALVLRHAYGSVQSLSSDGSSLTFTKVYETLPIVTPETAVASEQSLTVLADSNNGTIVYDVDHGTSSIVTSFSAASSLLTQGEYVRVAARYQENGTLTATRVWASSSFNSIWLSPEGHVTQVDASNAEISVLDEAGLPVHLGVNASTQFFFHEALNPTAIGTGPAFLANLVRGFKVHVSVVDPLAASLVAQTVDIETAAYTGQVSLATATGFTYTHDYVRTSDDYQVALPEILGSSSNPGVASSTPVDGFAYWNFAYPTQLSSGTQAGANFASAVGGDSSTGYSFAGSTVFANAASAAVWGDTANPQGWAIPWAVLMPTLLPLATVATPLSQDSFTVTTAGSSTPGTVTVNETAGSATLVYQLNRSGGVLTLTPVDITTMTGQTTLSNALTAGTLVKLYGVPQSSGALAAYVLVYFTGDLMPAQ